MYIFDNFKGVFQTLLFCILTEILAQMTQRWNFSYNLSYRFVKYLRDDFLLFVRYYERCPQACGSVRCGAGRKLVGNDCDVTVPYPVLYTERCRESDRPGAYHGNPEVPIHCTEITINVIIITIMIWGKSDPKRQYSCNDLPITLLAKISAHLNSQRYNTTMLKVQGGRIGEHQSKY